MTDIQPAGEHHIGSLALSGEGNVPQPISAALVRAASFAIAEHRTPHWHDLPEAIQNVEAAGYNLAMRSTLEAAYPAVRQQVAEEIAVALEQFAANDIRGRADMSIDRATEIARQVGRRA